MKVAWFVIFTSLSGEVEQMFKKMVQSLRVDRLNDQGTYV